MLAVAATIRAACSGSGLGIRRGVCFVAAAHQLAAAPRTATSDSEDRQQPWQQQWQTLAVAFADLSAGVRAAVTPSGRGVVASQDLPQGAAALSVPWSNLLVTGFGPSQGRRSTAAGRLYLQAWQQRHQPLPPPLAAFLAEPGGSLVGDFCKLMAWLLWLRQHGTGPWRTYADLLPQEPPPLPMSFPEEALSEMQSPGLEAAARQHARKLAGIHDRLFSSSGGELGPLQLTPRGLRDTVWAACVINSRVFQVSAGENLGTLSVLAPLADFANHAEQPNSAFWFNQERGTFQLLALEDIGQGTEITLRYLTSCNADLLRGYGFTLPGNIHDRIHLPVVPGAPRPTLRAPRLLATLGLQPSALDGMLGSGSGDVPDSDSPTAAAATLGRSDSAAAAQHRRLLAVVASLQPFFQTQPGAGGTECSSSSSNVSSSSCDTSSGSSGSANLAAAAGAASLPQLSAVERHGERQAAAALAAQCQAQLDGMPTTLEVDEVLLVAGGGDGEGSGHPGLLSPCVQAAVAFRAERKRLLLTAADALQQYCHALG